MLLNPLKNMLGLGGGNSPSFWSLFNNTGGATNQNLTSNIGGPTSLIGGSGAAGGSGSPFGALGMLGNSLFGKEGLFGSQGMLFGPGGWFGTSSSFIPLGTTMDLAALELGAANFVATLPTATMTEALLMTGIYHGGGRVGDRGTQRMMPLRAFAGAPRLHSGGMLKNVPSPPRFSNDEVPAVLQRDEVVLTRSQQSQVAGRMAMASRRPVVITPTINVMTPDADSFRKSKGQVAAETARTLAAASRRM
jgi:hypothetical protein